MSDSEDEHKEQASVRDDSDNDEVNPENECEEKPADAPESEGGEEEPSDAENIAETDGDEKEESESETEDDKRRTMFAAQQFFDIEAEDREARETNAQYKKRMAREAAEAAEDRYESEGLEEEGEITYDTDVEEERKRKGKKPKGNTITDRQLTAAANRARLQAKRSDALGGLRQTWRKLPGSDFAFAFYLVCTSACFCTNIHSLHHTGKNSKCWRGSDWIHECDWIQERSITYCSAA